MSDKEIIHWDITHQQALQMVEDGTIVFDPELSYETTKYRPITQDKGLDFDPALFTEPAKCFNKNGRFTVHPPTSKQCRDFWIEQREYILNGRTINNYTLTGDNYFFINFYKMSIVNDSKGAAKGSNLGIAEFMAIQYQYFHYIEMCKILKLDACLVKARGVGASEMAAGIIVNGYTIIKNYKIMVTAYLESYLTGEGILTNKVWPNLDHLNQNTDLFLSHVRMKIDQDLHKRASKTNKQNEELSDSWYSEIFGKTIDKPSKLRGGRMDLLFMEEAGSNPYMEKSYLVAEALVVINGDRKGIRVVFGTGGGEGKEVEGLEKIFLHPKTFSILPYRHNHTNKGQYVETGFFIPAWTTVRHSMDHRGVADEKIAKNYYDKKRREKENDPKTYVDYCSEFCYTVDEAFSKRGINIFNQNLLAEAYVNIKIHKTAPTYRRGFLFWTYDSEQNINGVRFSQEVTGNILIMEDPVRDSNGNVVKNLYIGGTDSIDIGTMESSSSGGSSFCQVIKKRTYGNDGNKYVAMYIDRPKDVREAYGNAARLLWYYSCKTNLEDSKINFRAWLRDKKLDHKMLMRRPNYALNERNKSNSHLWGTPATTKNIAHGLELISLFIEDSWHTFAFEDMVEQLQKYSYEDKKSFDIIAAMQMAEIGDEDMYSALIKEFQEEKVWIDIGYYTDSNGNKRYGVIPGQERDDLFSKEQKLEVIGMN